MLFLGLGSGCAFEGAEVSPNVDGSAIDSGEFDSSLPQLTWDAPERILELGTDEDERFPSPSRSGTALWFTRTEMIGSLFVNVPFRSLRTDADSTFSPPSRVQAFGNTSVNDLEMRDDEREWFFWFGLGSLGFSERPSPIDPFGPIQSLGVSGFSPTLTADGLALYYVDLSGDVYSLRRASRTEPWGSPVAVGFSSSQAIDSIDISADELSMLVAIDPQSFFAGIYVSRRETIADPFPEPELISNLEGPYSNPRFGPNEDEIFFTAPLAGSEELYRSRLVAL